MVYPGYSTWKVGTDVQPEMKDGERLNMTLRAKVPFSSEAIPMKDRSVIADGKVETLHGGARMSYYLGIEPTGDYSAYSCENGSVSFEEMKKEPYLYAVTFSDFQMDTMSGHFGGEIRLAYLFDGERVRIVTGGSVNGSINACSGGMKFHNRTLRQQELQRTVCGYASRRPRCGFACRAGINNSAAKVLY